MNKFQEMVRARLRERTPNFSVLAAWLKSDPSTIQKRLKEGGTALCLDWLDEASSWYQMSVAEMVTVPEATWQEVKPLEAQLLRHFRAMQEHERTGLLAVLSRQADSSRPRRTRSGRPLTETQQLVVDLFEDSSVDDQKGVLQVLRGTAKRRLGRSDRSPSDGKT